MFCMAAVRGAKEDSKSQMTEWNKMKCYICVY